MEHAEDSSADFRVISLTVCLTAVSILLILIFLGKCCCSIASTSNTTPSLPPSVPSIVVISSAEIPSYSEVMTHQSHYANPNFPSLSLALEEGIFQPPSYEEAVKLPVLFFPPSPPSPPESTLFTKQ